MRHDEPGQARGAFQHEAHFSIPAAETKYAHTQSLVFGSGPASSASALIPRLEFGMRQAMANEQNPFGEVQVDKSNLYREESFTDLKVATIRRLSPIKEDGSPDTSRPQLFTGETTLMSGTRPPPAMRRSSQGPHRPWTSSRGRQPHRALRAGAEMRAQIRLVVPGQVAEGRRRRLPGGAAARSVVSAAARHGSRCLDYSGLPVLAKFGSSARAATLTGLHRLISSFRMATLRSSARSFVCGTAAANAASARPGPPLELPPERANA